ncbi:MAG: RibD family protein [Chloroflexi bacterium]|nr:RibD family protein [Chloroflexota bacterium]
MASIDPRPFVTLTYAQSLDGSIAARPGASLVLSCAESKRFTHQLRAQNDAILVGIGTVLADDPQLNVRLAPGANPRPLILDSDLRCPINARCVDAGRGTIIVARASAPMANQRALENVGAQILRVPATDDGIDLRAMLEQLARAQIKTLMVEGGARVITNFLRARFVDRIVITLAPVLIGGIRGVNALLADADRFPRLRRAEMRQLGEDWIVSGEIEWI